MVTLVQLISFMAAHGGKIIHRGSLPDNHLIKGPRNGDQASQEEFTFFNTKAGEAVYDKIAASEAALIILEDSLDDSRFSFPETACVFLSKDAKKTMMEAAKTYFLRKPAATIHPHASIHPEAVVERNASIGSGVVIEQDVTIGEYCTIEPNVYIQSGTVIGNRVHIKANAVIGGNGFGYVKTENGSFEHLPHFGKVIIEDDVHIGSNTCIDRGSLSDTIIRKGVKIDNLVHIAHNVDIGEHTLVIACSMIAGSVKIGEQSWIAPAASIKNGITIGSHVTVGMSSLVLKSVEDGKTVAGVPAKELGSK